MEVSVSVIIPIFKAESYLCKCLDSFVNQDFTNFELILVDDGSPDSSGKICDGYAIQDKRIKVIHKTNEGVSVARQTGLDKAQGKYVIHADPDDWVEKDMLSTLFQVAESENADVVMCDMWVDYNGGTTFLKKQNPSGLEHETILKDFFYHLHGSMCNKLIRRECFSKYQVRFNPKISYCEDFLVCIALYKHPLKTTYCNRAFYHYVQDINANSIVNQYSLRQCNQDKLLFELVDSELTHNISVSFNYRSRMAATLLERGFQSNIFSNKDFQKIFNVYRPYIKDMPISFIKKLLYKLSCSGGYKIAYKIYHFLRK